MCDTDGITEADLLDEISREYKEIQILPGEITATMLSDHSGIPRKIAAHRLEVLWRTGKYSRRKVLVDGRYTWAYRKK